MAGYHWHQLAQQPPGMTKEVILTGNRIVITGLGAITPLGLTVDEYWQGLINGKTGFGPITLFDASTYPVKVAAEAIQIFGGNGLSKEYPIEKIYRDAKASMIEDGENSLLALTGAIFL